MTVEEARKLNKGDYVVYNGSLLRVLSIKECRDAYTNELYISVRCRKKYARSGETLVLSNEYIERYLAN
jgi:translation elongation factor P/translation initiation factor 5A